MHMAPDGQITPRTIPIGDGHNCFFCDNECKDNDELSWHVRESETTTQRAQAILEDDFYPAPKVVWRPTVRPSDSSLAASLLFTPENDSCRRKLWNRLASAEGQNGITHDDLYQVICFIVHWALASETRIDPDGFATQCQIIGVCEDCNKKPGVEWKEPADAKAEDEAIKLVSAADQVQYSTVAQQRAIIKIKAWQRTWLFCQTQHHPELTRPDMVLAIGKHDHLGVEGRFQWAPFQVALHTVLHTIDMLLMLLAWPDAFHINARGLPLAAFVCLVIQDKFERIEDSHNLKLDHLKEVLDGQFDLAMLQKMERDIHWKFFDGCPPGSTIFHRTDCTTWFPVEEKKHPPEVNSDLKEYSELEDRLGQALFKMYDKVPIFDEKVKVAPDYCSASAEHPCLCLVPSAYPILFESYQNRRMWFAKNESTKNV